MGIKRLTQPVVWRSVTSGQVASDVGLPGEPVIQWSGGVPYVRIMDGVNPGGTIVAEGMAGGINTPSILSPPQGMIDVSVLPIFTASAFVGVSSDAGATHIFSIWEIGLNPDFTDTVYFSGTDASALTALDLAVKGISLEYGTTYYVHVKYGSSVGKVSEWSPVLTITTEVNQILLQTGNVVATSSVSGAYFGYATDISDDGSVMVIGAQGDSVKIKQGGSASVLRKIEDEWITEEVLVSSDMAVGDFYGYKVAISGDGNTVAIGAPLCSHKAVQAGAVYLYRYQGGRWAEIQKIIDPSAYFLDRLGVALGLSFDGSVLAVGAGWKNHSEKYDNGSVLVYRHNGYVWDLDAELKDIESENYAYFGRAVAISSDGNTVIVGAAYSDLKGSESGTAYIYQKSDGGWELSSRINAWDAKPSQYFGESVAISGDGTRIAIGATWAEGVDVTTGAVYCYEQIEGSWVPVTKVYSDDGKNGDYFGLQVALNHSGNQLAISASTDNGRGYREGSVKTYRWSGKSIESVMKHTASDGEAEDNFGAAIALSKNGKILVVGSPHDDDAGASSGAVYIYS